MNALTPIVPDPTMGQAIAPADGFRATLPAAGIRLDAQAGLRFGVLATISGPGGYAADAEAAKALREVAALWPHRNALTHGVARTGIQQCGRWLLVLRHQGVAKGVAEEKIWAMDEDQGTAWLVRLQPAVQRLDSLLRNLRNAGSSAPALPCPAPAAKCG